MKTFPALRSGRTATILAALTATLIALSGCTPAVDAPPPAASPTQGGTMTVATPNDAQPSGILGGYASNWPWASNVFETLVRLDPETLEPEPQLATDWEVADDGLSMQINLRDDVTFHTGREFTADDVKFSLEKVLDPASASQVAFIARQFKSVEVTSPTSLTITFESPLSNIFDLFAQTNIVDRETFAGLADGSQVIGTGPYVWDSWNPGASYSIARYDDYRDEEVAYLDSISYEVIANSTAQLSAVRSGRAQVAYGLSITDTQSFVGNNQFSVKNAGGTIYPFGMNVTVAPFDNPEVRKAVAYAIDRDRINDQVFQGTGTVTNLFWGPKTLGYSEDLASTYTYDPDRAKRMIEDAGATGASIEVVFMSTPIVNSIYEIFANNLEAIGLNTSAVQLDSPTFISRQVSGDLGAMFLSTHGQVGRGPATLIESLPTLREGNPSHFWSSEYEQLRKDLLAATDEDSRAEALEALSSYMIEQAFVMSILQAPRQIVVSNAVQGLEIGSFGELFAERAFVAQ